MRPVIVYYERLLGAGGAERQAVEEIKFLLQLGVQVRLVTHQLANGAIFDLAPEYVDILRDGSRITQISALRRRVRELKPAIVSVHSGHFETYVAVKGLGIPYMIHHNSPVLLHHGALPDYLYAYFYRRAIKEICEWSYGGKRLIEWNASFSPKKRLVLEAKALANWSSIRNARLVVVLSELTGRELKRVYGVDALVSRGCLDKKILSYVSKCNLKYGLGLQGKRVILSVSRLSFEKRIDVLLKAFKLLLEKMPDLILLIVGKGPDTERLKALTNELGLSKVVCFLGFLPDSDLWEYYAMCDLFASPAWADFDIAPYEALAFQKKVVWSSEMETEPWVRASGMVFEAEPTPEAFANAMKEALQANVSGRIDLSPYTWESKFQRIYQKAAANLMR